MSGFWDVIAKLIAWVITGETQPEVSWRYFAQKIIGTIVRFLILAGIVLLLREVLKGDILVYISL